MFSPRITLAAATARQYWLTYKPDQFWNAYYSEDIPTLILQGELDPQTPHFYGIHAISNYNKPYQSLVSFPYTPHETVRSDKVRSVTNYERITIITKSFRQTVELKSWPHF